MPVQPGEDDQAGHRDEDGQPEKYGREDPVLDRPSGLWNRPRCRTAEEPDDEAGDSRADQDANRNLSSVSAPLVEDEYPGHEEDTEGDHEDAAVRTEVGETHEQHGQADAHDEACDGHADPVS